MVLDMDGNPLGPQITAGRPRQLEWLEIVTRIFVTIFFTVNFFIIGLIFLKQGLAISIIEMDSALTILANFLLLLFSVASAWLLSPHIMKWAKENIFRITK
jgi:hypothetical protein